MTAKTDDQVDWVDAASPAAVNPDNIQIQSGGFRKRTKRVRSGSSGGVCVVAVGHRVSGCRVTGSGR